jgi:hypothetical protein
LSREPGGQTVAEEFEASLEGGPVWLPAEFRPYEREHHVRQLVVELGGLRGGEAGRPEHSRQYRPERKGVRADQRPGEQRHDLDVKKLIRDKYGWQMKLLEYFGRGGASVTVEVQSAPAPDTALGA